MKEPRLQPTPPPSRQENDLVELHDAFFALTRPSHHLQQEEDLSSISFNFAAQNTTPDESDPGQNQPKKHYGTSEDEKLAKAMRENGPYGDLAIAGGAGKYILRGDGRIAPGFRKRLGMLAIGIAAASAGIFGLKSLSNSADAEKPAVTRPVGDTPKVKPAAKPATPAAKEAAKEAPAETAKPPTETAKAPAFSGNVIVDVNQALTLAKGKQVEQQVVEIFYKESGLFTYQLMLKPQTGRLTPSPSQRSLYLEGVAPGAERERLLRELVASGHSIQRVDPNAANGGIPVGLIGVGAVAALMIYLTYSSTKRQQSMIRQHQQGMGAGKDNGIKKLTEQPGFFIERPDTRFNDVGGCREIIEEAREIRDDILDVNKGTPGVKLPKAVLLKGPTGTGKSFIGKAIAGEANIPCLVVDSAQAAPMLFVGTGQMKVRDIFARAGEARDAHTKELRSRKGATGKEQGVCMVILEEFDSIGAQRNATQAPGMGDADASRREVVNTLLAELDSCASGRNHHIIVIATTNLGAILDDALMRPGRFPKKILVDLPFSPVQRLDILNKQAVHVIEKAGYSLENPLALEALARVTPRKSGDELRQMLEEAVDVAHRQRRNVITDEDMAEAWERSQFGRKKENLFSPEQHKLVVTHEAGHAIVAHACGRGMYLFSSEPRGSTGGRFVMDREGNPELFTTKRDLLIDLLIAAGGHAAEITKFGSLELTRGAEGDFQQLRGAVAAMISSGFFEGIYAQQLEKIPQTQWRREHFDIVDAIVYDAIKTSQEIIKANGDERFDTIVDELLTKNTRLVGKDAQAYFDRALAPAHDQQQAKVSEFLQRHSQPVKERLDRIAEIFGHKAAAA